MDITVYIEGNYSANTYRLLSVKLQCKVHGNCTLNLKEITAYYQRNYRVNLNNYRVKLQGKATTVKNHMNYKAKLNNYTANLG